MHIRAILFSMGKKIDKLAGILFGTLCSHAYYMTMTKNLWLSLILTSVTMVALRRILKTVLRVRKSAGKRSLRARRQRAQKKMDTWLTAEESAASCDIAHLLSLAYPEEIAFINASAVHRRTGKAIPLVFLPRRTPLGDDDVLSAWKAHRGCDYVILASTAPAGSITCAGRLASPRVIIADRNLLEKLSVRHPEVLPDEPELSKERARPSLARLTDKKKAPRYLTYGALMFVFYLLLGAHAYLGAACIMLFLAGAGFHSAAAPERLL